MLSVFLIINWLCCYISLYDNSTNFGGNMLMAINNALMMVQAGFTTGMFVACSRGTFTETVSELSEAI